ncbi:hypothetical protein TNCV_315371 [Trichonephila clavipes]|nr:hypothetical protein TNCV_315371 [Trichonephila clavipes]
MDFTEINSRGKRGELLERIDRQNSRFRTDKTTIIKFYLHASFVELESAKSALNEPTSVDKSSTTSTSPSIVPATPHHSQQGTSEQSSKLRVRFAEPPAQYATRSDRIVQPSRPVFPNLFCAMPHFNISKGLGLNPGEDMDDCKCIVPLLQGGTILNSCRAANPLVRLAERKERWDAPDHPQVFSPTRCSLQPGVPRPGCKLLWKIEVQPVSDSGNFQLQRHDKNNMSEY